MARRIVRRFGYHLGSVQLGHLGHQVYRSMARSRHVFWSLEHVVAILRCLGGCEQNPAHDMTTATATATGIFVSQQRLRQLGFEYRWPGLTIYSTKNLVMVLLIYIRNEYLPNYWLMELNMLYSHCPVYYIYSKGC